MRLIKLSLSIFHPLLKRLYRWYTSSTRWYTYKRIRIKINPGIFHPGLFFSTRILVDFLSGQSIKGKTILELGAGTGLISIYCKVIGAEKVTASDISKIAISNIIENAEINHVDIEVTHSDLFDNLNPSAFDIIIINPPYYPKPINNENDYPWYCGEQYEYFEKLFQQLKEYNARSSNRVLMILSEDCSFQHINSVSNKNGLKLTKIFSRQMLGEWNYIYQVSSDQ